MSAAYHVALRHRDVLSEAPVFLLKKIIAMIFTR